MWGSNMCQGIPAGLMVKACSTSKQRFQIFQLTPAHLVLYDDCLIDRVVKASTLRAADPGFDSCSHCIVFSRSSHTSGLKIHTPVQGSHLREKTAFFTQKKSRLRKSENAVRLLYAKNSDHTHQNVFSLFVFCTRQRRFVGHLPWV